MIFLILLIVAVVLYILSMTVRKMDDWMIPSIITAIVVLFVWMVYILSVSSDAYSSAHYHVIEDSRTLIIPNKNINVNVPDDKWIIYILPDGSISSKMKHEREFKKEFTKYFHSELRYVEQDSKVQYFLVMYHTRWGWIIPWPERGRWVILNQIVQ